MVFVEFLEMVEADHSLGMVDAVIAAADLPHGGAYTSVGTYPAAEMGALVGALAKLTREPAPALLRRFGRHTMRRFAVLFPPFFRGVPDTFRFLEGIEATIHQEVLRLYPDAEVPSVRTWRGGPGVLHLVYRSPRCMGDFAQGLIEGAAEHFGEAIEIARPVPHGPPAPEIHFVLQSAR
jgi:hypothetical protein